MLLFNSNKEEQEGTSYEWVGSSLKSDTELIYIINKRNDSGRETPTITQDGRCVSDGV